MDENNNEQATSVPVDSAPTIDKTADLKSKLPFFNLLARIPRVIKEKFTKLSLPTRSANFNYRRNTFRRKHIFWLFLFIAVAGLIGLSIYYAGKTPGQKVSIYQDERPLPSQSKAKQTLNNEFAFPLKNEKGKEVSKVEYNIESVELQDSIIVKGQRARAVLGRTFLIVNLKISNNHTQGIEINSRDYIRLSVNNQNEWIAPDIHNDPVLIQAISTKLTRLGFPINDTDKNLQLQVGEIKGSKQIIKLELKTL